MATVFKDLSEWTAEAGVNSQTHLVNFYDSVTGAQVTVTSASLGATHSDLSGGVLSIAVVGGRAQLTLNASGLTGSTTPRWWTATINGVTIATGANIYIVTKVTDTITAPTTLTQDYPTSGSVTHVHITGSGTVTGAGHKIDFSAGTLYGGITIDPNITISGMGDATHPVITTAGNGHSLGDTHIVIGDGVVFDACGQVFHFEANTYNDSYVTVGACTVNSNSLAAQGPVLASSTPQFYQRFPGNSNYPSTYSSGMVVRKGRLQLDAATQTTVAGKWSGLRCGIEFVTGSNDFITFGDLYINCTVTANTWADVANIDFSGLGTGFARSGKVLLRGGQWLCRGVAGITLDSGWIFSEGYSHSYVDIIGHASLDTIVDSAIFLPGHDTTAPSNIIGRIRVRGNGARVKIRRPTFISKVGESFIAGAVAIDDGQTLAELQNAIFYKLQIDRGAGGVTGDGCVTPCSTGETEQATTGSPLRPSTNANRMTTCDYNVDYQCVSVGGDTYQKYLVGTVAGSPGAHDPASADPSFSGGGTYTWDESAILAGTKSVSQVWTDIRSAFAPTNAAFHNTASDGADIGAVPWVASSSGSLLRRRRRLLMRSA
jgi:hypothetical protein